MYDNKSQFLMTQGTHAAVDMTSAAVQSFSWVCSQNCRITRIAAKVTTAMSSSVAAVLTFRQRPTYASSASQVSIGTLTIPAAALLNKIYYKEVTPLALNIGDQVVVEVTTASTTAGQAFCFVEADLDPEYAANQSNLVASA